MGGMSVLGVGLSAEGLGGAEVSMGVRSTEEELVPAPTLGVGGAPVGAVYEAWTRLLFSMGCKVNLERRPWVRYDKASAGRAQYIVLDDDVCWVGINLISRDNCWHEYRRDWRLDNLVRLDVVARAFGLVSERGCWDEHVGARAHPSGGPGRAGPSGHSLTAAVAQKLSGGGSVWGYTSYALVMWIRATNLPVIFMITMIRTHTSFVGLERDPLWRAR